MINDNSYANSIGIDSTTESSKFRNNQFSKKSRNADVGATLVGLTPSE
jgi:hypothetical protein